MEELIERCRKLLWYMSQNEVAQHLNGEGVNKENAFLAIKAAVILNG